jgi:hypothetical protein
MEVRAVHSWRSDMRNKTYVQSVNRVVNVGVSYKFPEQLNDCQLLKKDCFMKFAERQYVPGGSRLPSVFVPERKHKSQGEDVSQPAGSPMFQRDIKWPYSYSCLYYYCNKAHAQETAAFNPLHSQRVSSPHGKL